MPGGWEESDLYGWQELLSGHTGCSTGTTSLENGPPKIRELSQNSKTRGELPSTKEISVSSSTTLLPLSVAERNKSWICSARTTTWQSNSKTVCWISLVLKSCRPKSTMRMIIEKANSITISVQHLLHTFIWYHRATKSILWLDLSPKQPVQLHQQLVAKGLPWFIWNIKICDCHFFIILGNSKPIWFDCFKG